MSSQAVSQKKAVKRSKSDKLNKPTKKVCLSQEATSLLNLQLSSLKSVLLRQYPSPTNRLLVPSTTNPHLTVPGILKRSTDSPPKAQNSKVKKNSSVTESVLSVHSKKGLVTNNSTVPYVQLAITNNKVDSDYKTVNLCETPPKFTNSNTVINETDQQKIGLIE
ncbi:hypothetical protein J6590_038375 [Homalodisca vitripennis]|nr:hypothetical protein J6590_038375 [Homalodisca vitripennis]